MDEQLLHQYLKKISLPASGSHKGQNGKVMVIGGSDLFHAASLWSLEVVSRMVDMVFYSSVPTNNAFVLKMKETFRNGIVVKREEIESYIQEADVVLIGPGMQRNQPLNAGEKKAYTKPTLDEWEHDTEKIVNYLLSTYPHKKWVIDAGALQMVAPDLLNHNMIITPHQKEFENIYKKAVALHSYLEREDRNTKQFEEVLLPGITHFLTIDKHHLTEFQREYALSSKIMNSTTILTKGEVDLIVQWKSNLESSEFECITGGNVGMTKGGTGDVLAGLVAGLYGFTDDPFTAATVGSYVNKTAGDTLYKTVGLFFNASDLAAQIPKTLKNVFAL